MSPDLRASIEALYVAFARSPPNAIDGCPCCMPGEELCTLRTTPLREVGGRLAYRYASNALLTVGTNEDLRYFWPRLVELCVSPETEYELEEAVVFSKPRHADWRQTWTQEEQAATERVAEAIVRDVVGRGLQPGEPFDVALFDLGYKTDTWVCALGQCLEDVTDYLRPFLEQVPAVALLGLHEYQGPEFREGRLVNPFWEWAATNPRRVVEWFREPNVAAALAESYAAFGPDLAAV